MVASAYLSLPGKSARYLVDKPLVLGRTTECDIVLEDSSASRRHAEIAPGSGGFVWRDLGSRNGTFLNGEQCQGGSLNHGDELRIGETVLRFEIEGHVQAIPLQTAPASQERRLLETLGAVMNHIATNFEPCTLLDHILETAMPAIQAQRGAILLMDERGGLGGCPDCGKVHGIRDGSLIPLPPERIHVSQTVINRVLEQGDCVLYEDTGQDEELSVSASIIALHLRSILCAPLRAKHGILGILYVDSNRADRSYDDEAMLLARVVGNSAGIAIENARMHREMLAKQRIEQEIQTAWSIQQGFLFNEWPREEPRFEVYGETRPAKVVGGDFSDFVRPGPGKAGILIGDVSGKGVPAALTMAQLLARFRMLARDCKAPAEIIGELNRDLVLRSQRGLFCTLCYIVLDTGSGLARCANAGHAPVLRISAEGTREFALASGPPAGILEDAAWLNEETVLTPGETLLMYTDGIAEARSTATLEPYGLERLLGHSFHGLPPQTLVEEVNNAVREHCGDQPPHDDCTMIAMRYLG